MNILLNKAVHIYRKLQHSLEEPLSFNKATTFSIFTIQRGVQAAHAQHVALQHSWSTLSTDTWPQVLADIASQPVYCTQAKQTSVSHKGSVQRRQFSGSSIQPWFLGQCKTGAIRQEVELVGGRQKLEGCHRIREGSVAGNVVFSGGGVGSGVLSILQGESRKGARRSYENKSSHAGCP